MNELQAAFEEMKFQLEQYEGAWVISVYPADGAWSDSVAWGIEDGTPPVMCMSDSLYSMYCASENLENTHQRQTKVSE